MTGSRRLRLLLWTAAAVAATLVMIVASAAVLIQTDRGRSWVARGVERAIGEPGQRRVAIDRIDGDLLGDFRIGEITLSDREGRWLTIRSLSVSWQPGALLRGRLEIVSATAASVAVDRLPDTPAAAAEDEPISFDLAPPVDIEVSRYAVQSLALAAAVLGQPAALRASGSLRLRSDKTVAFSLETTQHDAATNRGHIAVRFDPATDKLHVDAAYDEASGGPVSRLLAIEGLPDLTVRIAGSGPVADWHGKLSAAAGASNVKATIDLAHKDGLAFGIAGSGNADVSEDAFPESLLAGKIELSARGAWRSDGAVSVNTVRLNSSAIALDGSGTVGPSEGRLDARVRLTVADEGIYRALMPGLTVDGLTVDVTVDGSVTVPRVDIRAATGGIKSDLLAADRAETKIDFVARGKPAGGFEKGTLTITGRIAGVTLPGNEGLVALTGEAVDWSLAAISEGGGDFAISKARVAGKAFELTSKGAASVAAGDAALTATLRLTDMAALGAVAGVPVTGRTEIKGPLSIKAFGEAFDAKLSGELQDLRFGQPALQALLGGMSELRATAALDQGRVSVRDVALEAAAVRLSAEASLSQDMSQVDGRYRVDLKAPTTLAAAMGVTIDAAPLAIDGSVSGAATNPALRGTVSSDRLGFHGQKFGKIKVSYQLSDVAEALRGRLDVAAQTPIGDATGSAALQMKQRRLHISEVRAATESLSARGQASIPLDTGGILGELTLDAKELRPLLSLAGMVGDGSGSARLVVSQQDGKSSADLKATARKLTLESAGEAPVDVDAVTLTVTASDLTGRQDAVVNIRVAALHRGALTIADGRLTATGTPRGGEISAVAKGDWLGDFALDAGARVAVAGTKYSADLRRLTGTALGQSIRLARQARLEVDRRSIEVEALELAIGPGRFSLSGRAGPDRLAATASATALPLAILRPLSGLDVSGRLSGEAALAGSVAQPHGTARASASGVRFGEDDSIPPIEISASAKWRDEKLALDGTVGASTSLQASLDAELPLRLDPRSMAVEVPAQGPLSGRLIWRGDIAEAWQLLPFDTHRLAGETRIDIRLGGTASAAKLNGSVSLADGKYENLLIGTVLKGMTAEVVLEDGRAKIEALSANDGNTGSISAGGQIEIDPGRNFPFDLQTTLRNFAAVRRDDVSATLSGDVGASGTVSASRIEGALTTGTVEVRVLDTLPPEVVDLDVVEINAPAGEHPRDTRRRDRPAGTEITLGVSVDMPRRVFVRGRGIDSEWGGKLAVSGTADAPRIAGTLTLVRGQVNVVGKVFKLDEGSVTFPPGETIEPEIDVIATNRSGDLETTVRVSGPAANPKISLSSVPDLPRDEIISRILFKKSTARLSGAEAIQLGAAVAELSGTGGGAGGLLDFARNALGVDVFRIDSSETADGSSPALSVGKYLTDEVYLGVKQGLTPESSSVGVEVEVTPHISVDSSVRQSGASETGVKFKLDY